MATKSRTILISALALMMSAPISARRLTTTQMRENTIRINALELEEEAPEVIEVEVVPDSHTIILDSTVLNFDFDKSNVKPQYFEMLRQVVAYVNQGDYNIAIIGHTDSKGSDQYNMALGQRRANSVRNKLVEFGLEPFRITEVSSRGERELLNNPDNTPQKQLENRRIEFKFNKR